MRLSGRPAPRPVSNPPPGRLVSIGEGPGWPGVLSGRATKDHGRLKTEKIKASIARPRRKNDTGLNIKEQIQS